MGAWAAVEPFRGDDGELIEAFTNMLDQEPTDYPAWWHELGSLVAIQLGGHSLYAARPDYGEEYAPGTAGFEERKTTRPALREEYIDLIGQRMAALVSSGLSEAFLVESLVRYLDDYVHQIADVEAINERRRGDRERFRAAVEAATDDDARAGFQRMVERLADLTAEEEVETWARGGRWTQASARLSPDRIGDWLTRRLG